MRGIFFTFDALFALMVFLAIIPIILFVSIENSSGTIYEKFVLQADDAINSLSDLRIPDVITDPSVSELYRSGVVTEIMANRSVMESEGGRGEG